MRLEVRGYVAGNVPEGSMHAQGEINMLLTCGIVLSTAAHHRPSSVMHSTTHTHIHTYTRIQTHS
jgi:hypothetical protein